MTFIIILLSIWLIGFILFRYIIPWLLGRYVRNITKNMEKPFKNSRIDPNKKEGEVNIDYIPEKEEVEDNNDDEGEYIDFEEVE